MESPVKYIKGIFITVRSASTRLPKKCYEIINGLHAIEHVIERAKRSQRANSIVLCTTEAFNDRKLCRLAANNGIFFYQGSTDDKLERWNHAARNFCVDFFVTFDGDDLLCDPELADMAFDQYERTGADFIESTKVPTGAFTYGIKVSALREVCNIKYSEDTEMIIPFFKSGKFKVEELEVPEIFHRNIRMTLDYPEDLAFFKKIFTAFGKVRFSLRDVLAWIDRHPEVLKINAGCQEKYLENQQRIMKATDYESNKIPWERIRVSQDGTQL
jgi:spore coat polysaccharide biosynthesis protein SpsF